MILLPLHRTGIYIVRSQYRIFFHIAACKLSEKPWCGLADDVAMFILAACSGAEDQRFSFGNGLLQKGSLFFCQYGVMGRNEQIIGGQIFHRALGTEIHKIKGNMISLKSLKPGIQAQII